MSFEFLQAHLGGCDFFGSDLLLLDALFQCFDLGRAVGTEADELFGGGVKHSILLLL